MAVLQLFATAVIAALVAHILYILLAAPLRKLPGPLLAKVTNLWRLAVVRSGRSEKTLLSLHRKYGKVIQIGPSCISVSDPDLIKVIFSSKDKWLKSNFYSVNDYIVQGKTYSTTFGVRDEAAHSTMIRPFHKLYALANIIRYEPLMDNTITYFLEQVQARFVDSKQPCPIDSWLHFVAWDTIAEITFSRRFGFLEQGNDVDDLIHNTTVAQEYMAVIGQMPLLDRFLAKNPVRAIGPPGFSALAAFAAKQLFARKAGEDGHDPTRRDFLDEFLDIQRATGVTDLEVLNWPLNNVLAGSDTIAINLRAVVYYLAKNLGCQARLQDELDGAALGAYPAFKEVSGLVYLDAVLKEAMRLHPAVGIPIERVAPEGGLRLNDGQFVPSGTIVGMNPVVVQRDLDAFGPDADEFIPDRWFKLQGESDEAYSVRSKKMKDADLNFGFGKRACTGKSLALVEMLKLIARLYRAFDIRLADPEKEWRTQATFFYFQYDMDVFLTAR